MKHKWEIRERVKLEEMLTGLAEESAELAQAALKYRRALFQTSYTPVGKDEAYERLCEEIADVLLYVDVLDVNIHRVAEIENEKEARWLERLRQCQQH